MVVDPGIELHQEEARHDVGGLQLVSGTPLVAQHELELGAAAVGRSVGHVVHVGFQKRRSRLDLHVPRDAEAHDEQPARRRR